MAAAACPPSGDAGFTLIEATVAMALVVVIFVGLMQSLTVSLRSARDNRMQQQATTLALEGIEFSRSLSWDELAMFPAAVVADPYVTSGSLVGAEFDLGADEPLIDYTTEASALLPYHTVEVLDGTDFDVFAYVTDAGTGIRRVVVVVEWSTTEIARHAHHTSTLISEVSAG